ncbi:hypothetical protein COW46_05230 [Candidatus Gracilibacteria bacterium CG17_big_fil_post_rev_8_21_14_2_50_48_13]|nr:MAG: hypothetical protein COW46_05230 [Candidatus Gracilibacteria bacterium CG17_big_fil_post_rev_8_21_14_2_50_48_13]
MEQVTKVSIALSSMRFEKNTTQYLLQKRGKEPFAGYIGLLTGKVQFGETIEEAAARLLESETGMTAEFHVVAIKHKLDYDCDNKLQEDKYFFVVCADNISGVFKKEFAGGTNLWMSVEDLEKAPHVFDGVEDSLHWLHSPQLTFREAKYISTECL